MTSKWQLSFWSPATLPEVYPLPPSDSFHWCLFQDREKFCPCLLRKAAFSNTEYCTEKQQMGQREPSRAGFGLQAIDAASLFLDYPSTLYSLETTSGNEGQISLSYKCQWDLIEAAKEQITRRYIFLRMWFHLSFSYTTFSYTGWILA